MWLQLALLVLCQVHLAVKGNTFLKEFRMPGIRVYKGDAYVCYAEPLPRGKSYITSFQPIYNEMVTHHMLLFACQAKPTTDSNPWNCDNEMVSQPVCAGNSMILFSWAMNAPGFKMPNDTSIPVGGTVYDYLVLQVHYKDIKYFAASPDHTDSSGWLLTMQTTPSKYLAGIYLFVMDGAVRPFGFTTIGGGCEYTGFAVLHPIAFRVHTHDHGLLVEAYVEKATGRYLIGKKSPQEKQTFYPVSNASLRIFPGDKMFAQCLMKNNEGRWIPIGNTRKDEMCNFYMMYSVNKMDAEQLLDSSNQICFPESSSLLLLESFK